MGGGRKVTSTDVARAAGVSQAVVSRAFSPEGKIADKTRQKVLSVARKLGYHPNALARSLVTQRSGLVGIIIGDITNPFYAPVLMELSKRLEHKGREVLLLNVEGEDSLKNALARAQAYRVEAVIATSITLSSRMVETFSQSGIPVILFNRYASRADVHAVSCDNLGGGARVADAFIDAGHTRFAFIGGKPDTSTNRDRRAGFVTRLRASAVSSSARPSSGPTATAGASRGPRSSTATKARPTRSFATTTSSPWARSTPCALNSGLKFRRTCR